MDAELLASVVAIVLSLAFSYVPGVSDRFVALDKKVKQMWMGILLILVAVGSFALSCGGLIDIGLGCDQAGAMDMLRILIAAAVANQAAYGLTKKEKPKKKA